MKRTYDFDIYWKLDDVSGFYTALDIFDSWAARSRKKGIDLTTKEIITKKLPELYNSLTRGDKIRFGRAVSNRYEEDYYPKIGNGAKKGSSRTYYIK